MFHAVNVWMCAFIAFQDVARENMIRLLYTCTICTYISFCTSIYIFVFVYIIYLFRQWDSLQFLFIYGSFNYRQIMRRI